MMKISTKGPHMYLTHDTVLDQTPLTSFPIDINKDGEGFTN